MSVEETTTAEVRGVINGMQDALTDEMVSRIAATVSSSAGLLDQLGRSGADKAIPVFARLVENGDLERIAQLARLVGAVQDAATDEMIVRLADVVSQTVSVLDRFNRADLHNLVTMLPRMMAMFDHLEQQRVVADLVHCLDEATAQAATAPSARGGLTGLWTIMREPDTQEALRFMLLISKQFRNCRAGREPVQSAQ